MAAAINANVLGTAIARAPRTSRTKSSSALSKTSSRSQLFAGDSALSLFSKGTDVISFLEDFVEQIQNTQIDKDIHSAILTLYSNLKFYGLQLESTHKGNKLNYF